MNIVNNSEPIILGSQASHTRQRGKIDKKIQIGRAHV